MCERLQLHVRGFARGHGQELPAPGCAKLIGMNHMRAPRSLACARLLFAVFVLPFVQAGAQSPSTPAGDPTVAEVADGKLRGVQYGAGVVFKGIPFARPPVGELRWREPQPVVTWSGVRDATQPGSACTQVSTGLNGFVAPLAQAYGAPYQGESVQSSEDCLYLNVWVPAWPAQSALPVMVWLHGGANMAGSGSQSTYDGQALVSHGVVLVTINYRLGVFGFFSHPELSAESVHHSSGNYGLLDQLAALEWVRKNISRFGGDPQNVTLFGESAGAIDAGLLITSPLSSGLFRRVISQSGPTFGVGSARTLAEAESIGAAIGRAAPGHFSSTLQNLRGLPAAQMAELADQVLKAHFQDVGSAPLVVDGWVLPRSPQAALAKGAISRVDLLVGLNGRELSAFRVGAAARQTPKTDNGGGARQAIGRLADAAAPLYGAWTDPAIAWYLTKALIHRDAAIDQASNDMLVACPLGAMATLLLASGQKAFVYRFDRTIPGKGAATLGAFHSLEIPYVFRAFEDPSWRWLPFTSADSQLSAAIQAYWTQFAKTGNPNSAGLPNWPAWNNDAEPFLEMGTGADLAAQRGFSPTFCHLSPDRLRERLE
jgi:para-nitrobenzyl esterase